MRKRKTEHAAEYKILALDDEVGIIDSLAVVLKRNGYGFEGLTSPYDAIERIRTGHYDLLILDYMMQPINGDKVSRRSGNSTATCIFYCSPAIRIWLPRLKRSRPWISRAIAKRTISSTSLSCWSNRR